jgi:hypothetical protein
MMRASGSMDREYAKEVASEALEFEGLAFSRAAREFGYKNDKQSADAFCDRLGPDGKRLYPPRANEAKRLVGLVHIVDNSITNFVAAGGFEVAKKVASEVMVPAMKALEQRIEQHIFARRGADGHKKEKANVLGFHAFGVLSREGKCLVHGHSIFEQRGQTEDGKIRSLDTSTFFEVSERDKRIFQCVIADRMEQAFGIKMSIDSRGMAVVEGVTQERDNTRAQRAEEYLKQENIKSRSASAKAYAYQNTREKKAKVEDVNFEEKSKEWQREAYHTHGPKVEAKKVQEHERGRLQAIVEDYLKIPVGEYVKAYKVSRNREQMKMTVNDVQKFIDDTKDPSRWDRHKHAMKVMRRTHLKSLKHAAAVGQRAYKEAKPKVNIPPKTRVAVNGQDIKSKKQFEELKALATQRGWRLKVRNEHIVQEMIKRQEQSERQKL